MKDIEKGLSITDVSKILGKSPQFVRIGLQQQRLPFGTAVQLSSEWTYHISKKLLEEYAGEEVVKKYYENQRGNI